MGIIPDTHLHGQQYAWLTTCGMTCFVVWPIPDMFFQSILLCKSSRRRRSFHLTKRQPALGVSHKQVDSTTPYRKVLGLLHLLMGPRFGHDCSLQKLYWTGHCQDLAGRARMRVPACIRVPVGTFCSSLQAMIDHLSRSTMYYTRAEQALVIGSFYSMNGFQQCVGGLIGYGISQIQV